MKAICLLIALALCGCATPYGTLYFPGAWSSVIRDPQAYR
jgi:hypothetical protein